MLLYQHISKMRGINCNIYFEFWFHVRMRFLPPLSTKFSLKLSFLCFFAVLFVVDNCHLVWLFKIYIWCVCVYNIYIRIVCFLSPSCDFAMRVCEVGADLTSLKQWCSSDSDTVLDFSPQCLLKHCFSQKRKRTGPLTWIKLPPLNCFTSIFLISLFATTTC